MNYSRVQVELLRKTLGTLAAARAGTADDSAELTATARPSTRPATSGVSRPAGQSAGQTAGQTADPAADQDHRPRQDAASYFAALDWSGSGVAQPDSAENLAPTAPQRDQSGSARDFFGSLDWASPSHGSPADASPQAAAMADANPRPQPASAIAGYADASAFFSGLPWSGPATAQPAPATTQQGHAEDISPGDFASMATTTALNAARKAAS